MLQKIRVLLLVCFTAVLAACGGGGGGDDTPNFAGNYDINLTLSSNNCNAAVETTFAGRDSVTQDGRNITIGLDGDSFKGSVDADNGGFSASFTEGVNGTSVVGVIAFRTTTAGSKYAAQMSVTAGACSIFYVGTATKI